MTNAEPKPQAWSAMYGDVLLKESERIRREDCSRCEQIDCEVSTACRQRFWTLDARDQPMCKWAKEGLARKDREEKRHRFSERLEGTQSVHPDWITMLAEPDMSCRRPPDSWFAAKADDRGAYVRTASAVEQFVQTKEPEALVVSGSTGTGKTLLAAWAFARIPGAVWVRAACANTFETWEPWRGRVDDCSALFIDDLGRERDGQSHYATETLAEAISAALDTGRYVFITSNLLANAIRQRYGERLYSRLYQQAQWLSIGNNDLRAASKTSNEKVPLGDKSQRRARPASRPVSLPEKYPTVPEKYPTGRLSFLYADSGGRKP